MRAAAAMYPMALGLALAVVCPSACRADDGQPPPVPPRVVVEYAEDQGTIVSLSRYGPPVRPADPDDVARLRRLVEETAGAIAAPSPSPSPAPSPSPTPRPSPSPRPAPTRPAPPPSPAAPDHTRVPAADDRILCPDPLCKAWNDVTERFCTHCGGELRDSPEIRARRAKLLEAKLYAGSTEPAPPPSPEPPPAPSAPPPPTKRPGPAYGEHAALIEQLGTEYAKFATGRLQRAGVAALPDLGLALGDPERTVRERAGLCLDEFVTPENAAAVASALRTPASRPAAARALAARGLTVMSALFDELAVGDQGSLPAVTELLGKLGEPVVSQVQTRLVPENITLYPRFSQVLVAVGRSSVPLLTGILADSDDEYLVTLAADTLTALGDRSTALLLTGLRDVPRLDRKKRFVEVLGRIKAPDAVDAVVEHLRNRRFDLHAAARQALSRIATERSLMALGELLDAGRDEQDDAMGHLLASPGPVLRVLTALLASDRTRIREAAVRGLGTMAARNPEARRLVEEAAKDGNRTVKREAERVLEGLPK